MRLSTATARSQLSPPSGGQTQQFVLQPNNSSSSRSLVLTVGLFALAMLLLGMRFAYLGVWLILPFIVLDVLAVCWAIWHIKRRCSLVETVTLNGKQLNITHQAVREQKQWGFAIDWVKVDLQSQPHPWHPSRLRIGSHGKWVQIGDFLTNDERTSLASALSASVLQHRNTA